jgi:hypothetical protein
MGIESIFPSWAVLMTFQLTYQEQDKAGHRRILPNIITQATETRLRESQQMDGIKRKIPLPERRRPLGSRAQPASEQVDAR